MNNSKSVAPTDYYLDKVFDNRYLCIRQEQLAEEIYLEVVDLSCPNQHSNQVRSSSRGINFCRTCGEKLERYLLVRLVTPYTRAGVQKSRRISNSTERILDHLSEIRVEDDEFLLLRLTGDWNLLSSVSNLSKTTEIFELVVQCGEALQELHQHGIHLTHKHVTNPLRSIVVIGRELYISNVVRQLSQPAKTLGVTSDLKFLFKFLSRFYSGQNTTKLFDIEALGKISKSLASLGRQFSKQSYQSVDDLLRDIKRMQSQEAGNVTRSLAQNAGYRTDRGQVRDHNEDYVGKYTFGLDQNADSAEVGLYIVADGMGGHQAGELASRDVAKEITWVIQDQLVTPRMTTATTRLDTKPELDVILEVAIQTGNNKLCSIRNGDRGTTITAVLIQGNRCAIGNVGDSRTYLLRRGQLNQLTQDHSFVAALVAAGHITPEEARVHPNKNQIHRTLGEKRDVKVDIFKLELEANDQLLLCSDGLWEMVTDDEILAILKRSRNPNDATDRLISAANKAGGEDNISAVVVHIQ